MKDFDVLSEVFSILRLESRLYFEAALPKGFSVALPRERRHIRFHLVCHGHAWLRVPGVAPERLVEGDLAIVPHGVEQVVSDEPDAAPVALPDILKKVSIEDGVLQLGDPTTRLLCGFCQYDEAIGHPVIAALPALVLLRSAELGAEPWTAAAIRLLAMETSLKAQGMTGIANRLIEIVLIQAVRRMPGHPDGPARGFIAALSDRRLSRALHAMHESPHLPWKVGDIAEKAGMSRARFAAAFSKVVGTSPIDYLTTWRLMKARGLLAHTALDIAEVALRCGYRSLPSFSHRFKKAFGVGPGRFRRTGETGRVPER